MFPSQNYYFNVNGYEGAKQFQCAPNQTVLLIDTTQPYIYMKCANQMGQCTMRIFEMREVAESPEQKKENEKFASIEAKIAHLEELLNGKPAS